MFPENFRIAQPSVQMLEGIVQKQSKLSFTYREVGWTREGNFPRKGYHVDKRSVVLGSGEITFVSAVRAMKAWCHFDLGFIGLYPQLPEIDRGTNLIVCAHHLNIWSINSCRIVYTIEEETRFGYGYGTLPFHSESGEERFLIEFDRNSGEVRYEILAFSKSNQLAVSLLWPVAEQIQDEFRVQSLEAMSKAIIS